MKKIFLLICLFFLTACGSVKKTMIQRQNDIKGESLEQENKELKLVINELKELKFHSQLSSENFSLNLSAIDGNQPAVYTEIKGKDTIYKVVVQNGVLMKNQLKKDSSLSFTIRGLQKEIQKLKSQGKTQVKSEQKNIDETKHVQRSHHWFWLGLMGIIAGLIGVLRKFKRDLTKY